MVNVYPGFKSQGGSLWTLSRLCNPQIQVWYMYFLPGSTRVPTTLHYVELTRCVMHLQSVRHAKLVPVFAYGAFVIPSFRQIDLIVVRLYFV